MFVHVADVHAHVLLQQQDVRELFAADRTLVVHLAAGACPMHAHVRLEVAFGGERSPADLAPERPLTSVSAVMHLQRAFTAQNALADRALIWIFQCRLHLFY